MIRSMPCNQQSASVSSITGQQGMCASENSPQLVLNLSRQNISNQFLGDHFIMATHCLSDDSYHFWKTRLRLDLWWQEEPHGKVSDIFMNDNHHKLILHLACCRSAGRLELLPFSEVQCSDYRNPPPASWIFCANLSARGFATCCLAFMGSHLGLLGHFHAHMDDLLGFKAR